MDHQPTPIEERRRSRRQVPAALDRAAMALQARLLWPLADAIRAFAGLIGRGLDRVAWVLQRAIFWPLQDAGIALGAPGRAVAFATVVVLAAGVGVAGLLWAAPDRPDPSTARPASASQPLAVAPTEKAPTPAPTLHGAAPTFKATKGGDASRVDAAKPIESSPAQPAAAAAADPISSSPSASSSSASAAADAAAVGGRPAGPAAVAVAREFAGAFVSYETGSDDATVRRAFASTATPELARSLLRRPPRLPANVRVPKAKVVNVVAGPSRAGVYSVSVSLLRVGLTSELRLDLEQRKGDKWLVTNVLG